MVGVTYSNDKETNCRPQHKEQNSPLIENNIQCYGQPVNEIQ